MCRACVSPYPPYEELMKPKDWHDPLPGTSLSPYEIMRKIGLRGMGEVQRAEKRSPSPIG